jgi:hypothetical protein
MSDGFVAINEKWEYTFVNQKLRCSLIKDLKNLVKACGAFSGSDKNTIPQSVLQRNENKKGNNY